MYKFASAGKGSGLGEVVLVKGVSKSVKSDTSGSRRTPPHSMVQVWISERVMGAPVTTSLRDCRVSGQIVMYRKAHDTNAECPALPARRTSSIMRSISSWGKAMGFRFLVSNVHQQDRRCLAQGHRWSRLPLRHVVSAERGGWGPEVGLIPSPCVPFSLPGSIPALRSSVNSLPHREFIFAHSPYTALVALVADKLFNKFSWEVPVLSERKSNTRI
ncbi:hypothetical protein DFH06DRAFT_1130998 [Mycena polygramma]|nr:hypothetical protein DFH06DRAFT_1130998 [Mycena polygramma]